MGHGPSASRLGAFVQTAFHRCRRDDPPSQALRRVNAAILDAYSAESDDGYTTAFRGVLNSNSHRLKYAAAAQEAMVIGEHGEITRLEATGALLGVSAEAAYAERVVDIPAQSLLIVATDGAFDEQLPGLTFDSASQVARQFRNDSPRQVIDALLHFRMGDDRLMRDDVAIVCVRC
jgi:serine phosphatase RsbU (regulator of sigma subunit)